MDKPPFSPQKWQPQLQWQRIHGGQLALFALPRRGREWPRSRQSSIWKSRVQKYVHQLDEEIYDYLYVHQLEVIIYMYIF